MQTEFKERTLPFGKELRVANFKVLKHSKTIDRKLLKAWRNAKGIPKNIQNQLSRGCLPYIKVSTISDNWSIEIACTQKMYLVIDRMGMEGPYFTKESENELHNLFVTWYADTTLLGDDKYMLDKGKAIKSFMNRQKSKDISKEEDDKILDEEKHKEKASENIKDMTTHLSDKQKKEGGENGSNGQTD